MNDRQAVVVWSETILDVLHLVPQRLRDAIIARVTAERQAQKERAGDRTFVVMSWEEICAPKERDGLRNHIMEAMSLVVQVFTRNITNNHSAEDAARILFREHRLGRGSGWLPHYLRDLDGLRVDLEKCAQISDENKESALRMEEP